MRDETLVPKPRADRQDLRILSELIHDGRASNRDIAERTKISLSTVNRHIRHMEETGIIRGYRTIVDPESVGWGLTVIVGLRIEKGHLKSVQQQIAKDHRIYGVYDVTGEWDGVVLARVKDRADLDDLAKGTLSNIHIQRTNTMVVLSTAYEEAVTRLPA